ncbi:hypothetical protein [Zunongwangia sp.]|uniref:hypothetical protein n=1 Tax=Zunongwangia sp. TaxID=1965325 RepID=UPI003AA9CACE
MKLIIAFFILIICPNYLIAQDLHQKEFDKINADVKNIIISIEDSDDFVKLIEKFNLSESASNKIDIVTQNNKITFLKNRQGKSHILPFYFLTENPTELKLTIFSLTMEPQRIGEEFHRGTYHFILTSKIKIEDGKPTYKDSEIIINQNSINNWFLKGYKTYLDKTGLVYKKFGYTPPPPPIPPNTL